MFDRVYFKEDAKKVLKLNYWIAFVVCLIISFVYGGGVGAGNGERAWDYVDNATNRVADQIMPYFIATIPMLILIGLLLFVMRILVGYCIKVGGTRYFINISDTKKGKLSEIIYEFYNGRWKNVVITMLYKGVLNFLWYLLFIIPGIVKHYSYSMVPYLLSENPNFNYKRAVDVSMKMTAGFRVDMLMLDFSFIGWYLLGTMLFGVGIFFVNPYIEATRAQMYFFLRKNALKQGILAEEELNEAVILG